MLDKIKGYKTVIFNVVMSFTMMFHLWQPDVELPDEAEVEAGLEVGLTAVTAIWGIGNVWLRAITHTPIFQKYH